MEKKKSQTVDNNKVPNKKTAPKYEPPTIVSYTGDEILEQIGPAQACSPSPCATSD